MKHSEKARLINQQLERQDNYNRHYEPFIRYSTIQPKKELVRWSLSKRLFISFSNFLEYPRVKLLKLKPIALRWTIQHFIRRIQRREITKALPPIFEPEPMSLRESILQDKARNARRKLIKQNSRSVNFNALEPSLQSAILQELKEKGQLVPPGTGSDYSKKPSTDTSDQTHLPDGSLSKAHPLDENSPEAIRNDQKRLNMINQKVIESGLK